MGLQLLEAFLIGTFLWYDLLWGSTKKALALSLSPEFELSAVQSSKTAIWKQRRKIFCFKYPIHSKCKQSAMFKMSRNQISCGISSLAFPRKLSVHDAQGKCLSGCTICKRCPEVILRRVFKPLDGNNFQTSVCKPSEELWEEVHHYLVNYHGKSRLSISMILIGSAAEH